MTSASGRDSHTGRRLAAAESWGGGADPAGLPHSSRPRNGYGPCHRDAVPRVPPAKPLTPCSARDPGGQQSVCGALAILHAKSLRGFFSFLCADRTFLWREHQWKVPQRERSVRNDGEGGRVHSEVNRRLSLVISRVSGRSRDGAASCESLQTRLTFLCPGGCGTWGHSVPV